MEGGAEYKIPRAGSSADTTLNALKLRFYGIEFDQICLYAESNHDGTCTNGW